MPEIHYGPEIHQPEIHYGVVRQEDGWTIIGEHLRAGPYSLRSSAVRAARRLAEKSAGLPVNLHIQDDTGELRPPERIDPDGLDV